MSESNTTHAEGAREGRPARQPRDGLERRGIPVRLSVFLVSIGLFLSRLAEAGLLPER